MTTIRGNDMPIAIHNLTYILNDIVLKKKTLIFKKPGASSLSLYIPIVPRCLRTPRSRYQSSTCTLSNQEHNGIIMGIFFSTCTNSPGMRHDNFV